MVKDQNDQNGLLMTILNWFYLGYNSKLWQDALTVTYLEWITAQSCLVLLEDFLSVIRLSYNFLKGKEVITLTNYAQWLVFKDFN